MGFLRRKSIRKEFDEILIQQLFKQKEEKDKKSLSQIALSLHRTFYSN